MIIRVQCKHCKKTLRENGFYQIGMAKREHLRKCHPKADEVYWVTYRKEQALRKEISELNDKQEATDWKDI